MMEPRRPRRRIDRIARRTRRVYLSWALWNRRVVFLVGSLVVGLVAVGFAVAATQANNLLNAVLHRWPWAMFVLAPAGFAFVSYVGRTYFKGAEGSGIPQTIAALSMAQSPFRDRLLSIRVAAGKILLTLVGLLGGASIGREGPTVQIGAAIMYSLDRISSFPHEQMKRGLILAGGAAGVAAAFNAPLAGVVFAIEEMSRSFSQRTSGIIITAVIIAGIVSLSLLGDYTYFGQTGAVLDLHDGVSAVVMCGIVGGILGGTFSRLVIGASMSVTGPFAGFRRTHPYVFAALCGLGIAILGWASHDTIYGTGYTQTRAILEHKDAIPLSFGVLKLLATVVSYASGIPGGIFSPSLAIGAGLGQDVAALLPGASVAAVAVLGMVAYFSGVVQAPITGFVIVLEMTRDSALALPIMAASLIAAGISRLISPRPLYKALAKSFAHPPAPPTA